MVLKQARNQSTSDSDLHTHSCRGQRWEARFASHVLCDTSSSRGGWRRTGSILPTDQSWWLPWDGRRWHPSRNRSPLGVCRSCTLLVGSWVALRTSRGSCRGSPRGSCKTPPRSEGRRAHCPRPPVRSLGNPLGSCSWWRCLSSLYLPGKISYVTKAINSLVAYNDVNYFLQVISF